MSQTKTTDLTFVRFGREHLALYAAWLHEPTTWARLGHALAPWFEYVMTTPSSLVWMVYDGEQAVGQVQVDRDEDNPPRVQVSLLVAPDVRGRGYGRRMVAALARQPALADVTHFYALIEADNTASIALFERAGFVRTDEPHSDASRLLTYVRTLSP